MKILVFENAQKASQAVFQRIRELLAKGPINFGLATGSTPLPLYELLRQSDLDFTKSTAINLDEYYGLAHDHPQSYEYFMNQHLFETKPFKENFIPDGLNKDVADETAHYDQILADHPIDFQILGIGQNAHIGFNEPGTPFNTQTHLVELTSSTIDANARFFDSQEEVPTQAYSMGIASIMEAKEIALLAFGENKAEAIQKSVEGPITEDVPASILQKHDQVTLYLDKAAASKLSQS